MFDKGESLKLDNDEVRTLEEDISSEHVKKLASGQSRHAEKGTTYGGLVGRHLGTELSGKPRGKGADLVIGRHLGTDLSGQPCGKGADLVSVPITQVVLGDITNIMGRTEKTSTNEHRKRKKKVYRKNTNEHMDSSKSTSTKRTCEEDCSGLPSKKMAVSLYDQATLLSIVEAVK